LGIIMPWFKIVVWFGFVFAVFRLLMKHNPLPRVKYKT